MRLKARQIPLVNFRRVLPGYLGPGEECFIEIDATAGGAVNPAYMAAAEALLLRSRVMDRKAAKIEDDKEFVEANHRNILETVKGRFGIIYDTCVSEWRTNILDGDEPLECNRANFLALTEQRIPELAAMFADLEVAILDAGAAVLKSDEETLKN